MDFAENMKKNRGEIILMKIKYHLKRIAPISLCICLLFVLVSCDPSVIGFTVPIKKLLDNPREYDNKTVMIEGQVTDVFSFVVIKAFAVRDKTGEIIVVTERILPKKGETVKVKGRIVEAFSFGDQSITAFKEWRE